MADETMTLEQVRDSLRRIGAHPNSLFSKWERAIEAAIAERKVPEWQPIETAPMDRRRVLLGSPTDTFTGKHADGIWIDDAGQLRDPTHWMPLRAAPNPQSPRSE